MSNPLKQRYDVLKQYHPALCHAIQHHDHTLCVDSRTCFTADSIIQTVLQSWEGGSALVIAKGVGDGQWLERLADQNHIAVNSNQGLLIIEPILSRFISAIEKYDFTSLLSSGYVMWCVGADWAKQWMELEKTQHIAGSISPALIPVYDETHSENQAAYKAVDSILQVSIPAHQKRFQAAMTALKKNYQKQYDGSIRRIWAPNYRQGKATHFVLKGMLDGLRTCGVQVDECTIPQYQYVSARTELWSLSESKPDLVLSSNLSLQSMYSTFAEGLNVPAVLWYTDAPILDFAKPLINPRDKVFCFDAHYIPTLSQTIGRPVGALQTAANLLEPAESDPTLACDVSVVANVQSIKTILEPFTVEDRNYLREMAEIRAADRYVDLETLVKQSSPPPGPLQRQPLSFIAVTIYAIANALYRKRTIQRLTNFDIKIWCGLGWLEDESDNSPIRRAYQGHTTSKEQLASIYHSSKIHVSLHSLNSIRGLNMHCWNAPYHQAFVLTENLPGIADCFEQEEEIACFDGADQLAAKVDHWLADSSGRRRIIEAGRERVIRDHTFPVRAQQLLDAIATRDGA
jgi:glycosyl transferase family 1